MAVRVSTEDFDEKVLSGGLHLADFYSDSCVPCKRMSPVLAELEEEFAGDLSVAKINVAYAEDLTEKYQVLSAPTFVFFKDGNEVGRYTGVQSKAELETFIHENL